jgi:chromate transporter
MTYASANRLFNIFENFYRNGSLIFGGGQVLIPLLKAEFVDLYQWLDVDEFLSGFGFVQAMPGPVFSFSGYIGAVSMSEYGVTASIWGGLIALAGVFLPGTFLIFFVIRFWGELKQYRAVRASIEGISAVGVGLVTAAAFLLSKPMNTNLFESIGITNIAIILITIGLLHSKKVPAPIIVVIGVVTGIISTYL